ncbi:MAG: hypothetical protein Q3983_07655 [Capnocytophaga sp.]|nr:hypothetical protein [Capnocytophaga sp.]
MQTKFILFFFFCISYVGNAQTIYIDVATTAAVTAGDVALTSKQKDIIKEQDKLKKAQLLVGAQVTLVEEVQRKIYKGLSEVSGTITNAIQVKNIYSEVEQCVKYSKEVATLVKKHPQYAFLQTKAIQRAQEEATKIISEVSNVIKGDGKILMTAGDRFRLLESIERKVSTLKIWIITIKIGLENIERIGFWKAINPFQGYINTDKDIIQNIMNKYKYQF